MNIAALPIDHAAYDVLSAIQVSRDGSYFTAGNEDNPISAGESLSSKLSDYIYRRFHCGMNMFVGPMTKADLFAQGLYDQFTEVTPVEEKSLDVVLAPGFNESKSRHDVVIDGLKVCINDSQLLTRKEHLRAGDTTRIKCPPLRPFLSPGFLYYGESFSLPPTVRWRLYFSVADTQAALGLWPKIVSLLAKLGLSSAHAKVGGTPRMYPRRDAIVVYLPEWREDWANLFVQETGNLVEHNQVSHFVRVIHPGIGLAQEPDRRAMGAPLSFGQHRSQILADTLVQASGGTLEQKVRIAESLLTAARINPRKIYQNLGRDEMQKEALL